MWPNLSFSPTAVAATTVNCSRYVVEAEDWTAEGVSFLYGTCTTSAGKKVYITDPSQARELGRLLLPFAIDTALDDAAQYTPADEGPKQPMWRLQGQGRLHVHRVVAGVPRVWSHRGRRADESAQVEKHDVITIRLAYLDATPSYCDEMCVSDGMWGSVDWQGTQSGSLLTSVNALYKASSYDVVKWPEGKGRVITVQRVITALVFCESVLGC